MKHFVSNAEIRRYVSLGSQYNVAAEIIERDSEIMRIQQSLSDKVEEIERKDKALHSALAELESHHKVMDYDHEECETVAEIRKALKEDTND